MDKPNLFDFATGELSQDAFVCWLLAWAHPKYRATDEALHRTGRSLLERLLGLGGIEPPGEVATLEVRRQYKKIDILVLVNSDIALLIEDKTDSFEHSGQLARYLDAVRTDFPARKVAAVFLKTGDQCDYRAVKQAGYSCFLRRDFLAVLKTGEEAGVRNDVFADFIAYLRAIEEAVGSYRRVPVREWGSDQRRWAGFFTALQERLGEGKWNYVANPSGGFMCFHYHWNGNKYLQLEEDQLCFKIMVEDKGQQAVAWQAWHEILMVAARGSELPVTRPGRRGTGTWMTVAVLADEYRQADAAGVLDMDRTVAVLKKAEELLDAAVPKVNGPSSTDTVNDGG